MANNTSTQQQPTTTQAPIKPVPRPQPVHFRDSAQPGFSRNGVILNENKK